MAEKIIFFSFTPITKQAYKRFDLDVFKRNGFKPTFYIFLDSFFLFVKLLLGFLWLKLLTIPRF